MQRPTDFAFSPHIVQHPHLAAHSVGATQLQFPSGSPLRHQRVMPPSSY